MLSPRDLLSRVILQGPPKVKGRSCYLFNSSFPCHEEEGGSSFPGQDRGKMPSWSCRELKPESGSPIPPVLLSSPWMRPREDAEDRDRKKSFHSGPYSASPFTSLLPEFFQLSPRNNVYLLCLII